MNPDARSPAMASPFLSRLRLATRDTHVAIERTLALTEPGLTLDGYQRVLEKFYGYYQPMEEHLQLGRSQLADWLDVQGRGKTPWLTQDLRRFRPVGAPPLPLCRDLPAMNGPAAYFGCMYVLEGATLGGVIISRHILENLSVSPLSGGRFFHGYGEATGRMWQQFRAGLAAFAETERDQEAVIASARATFETLRNWCELEYSQ